MMGKLALTCNQKAPERLDSAHSVCVCVCVPPYLSNAADSCVLEDSRANDVQLITNAKIHHVRVNLCVYCVNSSHAGFFSSLDLILQYFMAQIQLSWSSRMFSFSEFNAATRML